MGEEYVQINVILDLHTEKCTGVDNEVCHSF